MKTTTKVVISVKNNVFSIELAFNIFQRKVFSNDKLDMYIITTGVDEVKEMAKYIENCCFSNMNGIVINNIIYKDKFQRFIQFTNSLEKHKNTEINIIYIQVPIFSIITLIILRKNNNLRNDLRKL